MFKPYQKAELNFSLGTEIGQDGRNSKVFIAHDPQLDAEIVIKQIRKEAMDSPQAFFAESKALYASTHPNIVQILYACEDAESIFLAMPFYRNGSIKARITGQHMTVREIIVAASQVLSALNNIHSKGLIHFDVKPDNILISERGEALLSDFGQARRMKDGLAGLERHYSPMVPPEATRSNTFDRTFDIYQVGLTLYRMCNGNEEFYRQLGNYGSPQGFKVDEFKFDLCGGKFPDRSVFPPHIPTKLRNVIKRCLAINNAERYQSAIDVVNAMADIDGMLDWRLSRADDTKVWKKINDIGTIYQLTVNADGSSTFYQKTASGDPRRVKDGCRASVTPKEIQTLLGAY